MAKLTASERGWLGSVRRFPQTAWNEDGLKPPVQAKLEKIGTKLSGIKPGRPPKTAQKNTRAKRPPQEWLSAERTLALFVPTIESFGDYEVYAC